MRGGRSPGRGVGRLETAAIATSFNLGYLMLAFLVPVFAVRQGYSLAFIGFLTALPSLLQVPLRGVSGAMCAAWGERLLLRVAFGAAVVACLLVAVAPEALAALLAAQLSIGVARGLYWVPMQSYVTRQPGDRARAVGLLTSFNNAGALAGIVVAGPLAVALGYRAAFAFTAACCLVSLALTFALPPLPAPDAPPPAFGAALAELPRGLARPVIWLCGGMAMLSAIPQALVQSFYPVYLVHLGQGPAAASALTSLRSVGMLAAGFAAAAVVGRLGERRSFALAAAAMAAGLALTAWGGSLISVALCILAPGAASGIISVLDTTIAVDAGANVAERGINIGLVNIFFAVSMLVMPLTFGVVAGRIGLGPTFLVLGGGALLLSTALFAGWNGARSGALPASARPS